MQSSLRLLFYFIKVNFIRFGAKMQVIIQARFTSTPLFLIAAIAVRPAARSFPLLRRVDPAENVAVQAQRLLADEEAGYSAVFSGTSRNRMKLRE